MRADDLRLFALRGTRDLGARVARALGVPLAAHEERSFEDGEHKARPLVEVGGRDVFVLHGLYADDEQGVAEKLCRLLFFVGTVRDAGAARVTAIAPYLCYARKDRRTKRRDPLTLRYVAQALESVGTDTVVAVDVHDQAAFENAFRCRSVNLEARVLLVRRLVARVGALPVSVVSPDVGGVKRAELLRISLEEKLGRSVGTAFVEKHRSGGVVTGGTLVGDVRGALAVIVDDLLATGGTLTRAARACRAADATGALAAVTHGLFLKGAERVVADPALDGLLVTDTVPAFRLAYDAARRRVEVLDVAPLLAEAVHRLHVGGAVTELLERA